MESIRRAISWFYHEFGVDTILRTGRDAHLIVLARTCRMFAYGSSSLMLALFFSELHFSDTQIGLFMTFTLVGDVLLGTFLTIVADSVGRRKILFGGSFLMIFSGAVFAFFENFWILLLAAVVGVVSTTGGDFGPFRAIEESMIAELTTPQTRSDVLAWYITLSTLGSSLGSEAAGRIIKSVQELGGRNLVDSYHILFLVYTFMGAVNAGLVFMLTKKCEAIDGGTAYQEVASSDDLELAEATDFTPADSDEATNTSTAKQSWFTWAGGFLTTISPETRAICYKLWALLTLDSLSDGMVPYSLTNYYVDKKFHPSKTTLGDITSVAYLLSTAGTIFAGPLARNIGLINTMVFTHVPSSGAVLAFPWPNSLWLTVVLLFVRSGLNNMDQAPRAAFIAAVVKPEERTAVMGITTMVRTLGATAGPTVTGLLAGSDRFWVAFVAGGLCRLAYDFGLYALFVNMRLYTHETHANLQQSRTSSMSSLEEIVDENQGTRHLTATAA